MKYKLFDFTCVKRPCAFLTGLVTNGNRKLNVSQLAREVNCTYSHAIKIKNVFEEMGILTSKKQGREITLKLTEEGKKVAEAFREIRSISIELEVKDL